MNIVLVMRYKPVSRVHGIVALVQKGGEAVGAVSMNNLLIGWSKQATHHGSSTNYPAQGLEKHCFQVYLSFGLGQTLGSL